MEIRHLSKFMIKPRVVGVLLLALLLLFALSMTTSMAQGQAIKLSVLDIDTQHYPRLSAYVSVVDEDGVPLIGLDASDFTLSEDSHSIASPHVVGDTKEGLWLVLALDTSMKKSVFAEAQKQVKAFIATIGPQDKIKIIAFADRKGRETVGFNSNKTLLTRFIDDLSATQRETRSTYTTAALTTDILAKQGKHAHSAVILITDSGNVGQADLPVDQQTLGQLNKNQIPLYIVGFSNELKAKTLRSFTEQIMGESYLASEANDILAILQTLIIQLRQGYRLTWESQLPFDQQSHNFVLNLASPFVGEAITTTFTINANTPPPLSVDLLLFTNTLNIPGKVLAQVEVKNKSIIRDVEHVEFWHNGILEAKDDQSPYLMSLDISDYTEGDYEITAFVYDTLGQQEQASTSFNIQSTSNEKFWLWFLGVFWPIFLLILFLLITIWVLGKLLAWQRRNLRQKFALNIANEGNMPSRYALRAEEKGIYKTLQFNFLHMEKPLPRFQKPSVEKAKEEQSTGDMTTTPIKPAVITQVKPFRSKIQWQSQFTSNLAAALGPFGKAMQVVVARLSHVFSWSRKKNQPSRKQAQRQQAQASSERYAMNLTVVTPIIAPGRTLAIELVVSPPWRFLLGASYSFTVVSRLMDLKISEVKTINGQLSLATLRWYRRLLPLFVLLLMIFGMGLFLAILVMWIITNIG